MKVSRTRSYRIDMGKYESHELSATVTLEDTDLLSEDELADADPDETLRLLKSTAEDYLDLLLEDDLRTAADLSKSETSFLFTDPPRRTQRRERATTKRTTTREKRNT